MKMHFETDPGRYGYYFTAQVSEESPSPRILLAVQTQKVTPVEVSQCAELEELEFKLRFCKLGAALLGVGSVFRMKCDAVKV